MIQEPGTIQKNNVPVIKCLNNGLLSMHVSDVDLSSRKVQFVGHTYNYLYHGYEAIKPGAAARSIKENGPDSTGNAKIKFAWNHNLDLIAPGKIVELSEGEVDYKGQKVPAILATADINTGTLGNDLLIAYDHGDIDNHSIQFNYLNYEFIQNAHGNSEEGKKYAAFKDSLLNPEALGDGDMVCSVSEIKLLELGPVSFGAVDFTPFLGKKGASMESLYLQLEARIEKLNRIVRKGKQSDDMLQVFEIQKLQLLQVLKNIFGDVTLKDVLLSKEKEADAIPEPNQFKLDSFKMQI